MLSDLQIIAYNRLMQARISLLDDYIITRKTPSKTILKLLLENRRLKDARDFLKPPFPEFKNPSPKMLKLIRDHLDSQKNILIYGDYDVDGLTATALLWQALYPHSPHVFPYIPHRHQDGYAFKFASFQKIQEDKGLIFDLLITADNGIVAQKEFALAKKANPLLKIIVIDHHLAGGKLTDVDFIFHSTSTSASALAWFVSRYFDKNSPLSLAAIGVVADCQPLTGLNRSVVFHGLSELKLNPPPGLKKLLEVAHLQKDNLSTYELGFIIGPRLNASGRLSDATDSLRLLCSRSPAQAQKYAHILEKHNQARQDLQKESEKIAQKKLTLKNKIIFIKGDFNPGIIGLVAGRLTQNYALPSIVISTQTDIARGSCRSIPGVDITAVLRKFSRLFVDLGGHSGAAGFSIEPQNIPRLKKKLDAYFKKTLKTYQPEKVITADCQIDLSALTPDLVKLTQSLSPFGIGNPEPQFLFRDIKPDKIEILGKTQEHLKLKFAGISGIAFRQSELLAKLSSQKTLDFVATLSLNTWQGHSIPELIIRHIVV